MKVSRESCSRPLSTDDAQGEESRGSAGESADIASHQREQSTDPALVALPRRPEMCPYGEASTSSGSGGPVRRGETHSATPSSVLGKRSAEDVEDRTAEKRLKTASAKEAAPIMRVLKSGGDRVDEQDNVVTYFVRQSPTQIDPEMLAMDLNRRNHSCDLPVISQRVPLKISAEEALPNNDFSIVNNRAVPTCEFTRSYDSVWGISRPRAYKLDRASDAPRSFRTLKKVGTYFEQVHTYPVLDRNMRSLAFEYHAEELEDSGLEDSGLEDSGLEDSGLEDSGLEDSGLEESVVSDSPQQMSRGDNAGSPDVHATESSVVLGIPQQISQGDNAGSHDAYRTANLAVMGIPHRMSDRDNAEGNHVTGTESWTAWGVHSQLWGLQNQSHYNHPVYVDDASEYHAYDIESHAAYASRKSQKPLGSPAAMDLPTSKVELWEFSVGSEEASTVPPEINDLQVCYPDSIAHRRIGDIGGAKLATTVDCHELSPKYLLFRAASSTTGRNPPTKRQLVVVGKGYQAKPSLEATPSPTPGRTSNAEIDLPALRVSFDAPDGEILGMQIGGPFFSVQDTRPASTHYRKDGEEKHVIEVFKKNDTALNPWESLKKHAGTTTPGKLNDIKFDHACSVDHEVSKKNLAKVLHDNKELSAWLAHDSGADVIYIRKSAHRYHSHDDAAGLGDLLETLQNAGLINDYDEIRVSTSRTSVIPDKPLAVRQTYANAPRGTDPICTAELGIGSQNYREWALKKALDAKEKLVNFLGLDPP
ncbi:hypothetical protein [Xanthomonas translucens]|uniref:hypothetical protein n=1 Tax=Xanthomonas campestris pv. translucens TaxID=343 RepID=UPI000AD4E9DC|nr:hypothetical protein [Xanthomonas translucens]